MSGLLFGSKAFFPFGFLGVLGSSGMSFTGLWKASFHRVINYIFFALVYFIR